MPSAASTAERYSSITSRSAGRASWRRRSGARLPATPARVHESLREVARIARELRPASVSLESMTFNSHRCGAGRRPRRSLGSTRRSQVLVGAQARQGVGELGQDRALEGKPRDSFQSRVDLPQRGQHTGMVPDGQAVDLEGSAMSGRTPRSATWVYGADPVISGGTHNLVRDFLALRMERAFRPRQTSISRASTARS